jgi:solute carrier family 35 protein F5
LPPLNGRETAELALAFCFIWFIANWSVNASLSYTSVASATILSSTSGRHLTSVELDTLYLLGIWDSTGFFTLAIGRLFRVEKMTFIKIGAVCTRYYKIEVPSASFNDGQ